MQILQSLEANDRQAGRLLSAPQPALQCLRGAFAEEPAVFDGKAAQVSKTALQRRRLDRPAGVDSVPQNLPDQTQTPQLQILQGRHAADIVECVIQSPRIDT